MNCLLVCGCLLLAPLSVPARASAVQGLDTAAIRPRPVDGATLTDSIQARLDLAHQYAAFARRIRDVEVAPQWLRDGDRFVYWSATGRSSPTWVLVDARTGTQTPLLSTEELQGQLAALIGTNVSLPANLDFAVAPDQRHIVFNFKARSFSLGLTDRRVAVLAPGDPAALPLSRTNVVSPTGHALAVQRDGGFAVLDSTGRSLIERAGEANYGWRVPDRAWSPDGRFLVVFRNDARGVHKIPVVDYTSALERVTMVPYSKVGTPLKRSELYVVDPAAGRVTRVPGDSGETYDWFAGWRPDGSEALVLHLSRDGKRLDLVAAEPVAAAARLVLREERPESFVGALDFAFGKWPLQVTPLEDNRHFLWMSERDGWRHVYLYDYAGTLTRQVTKGAFPVHRVVGVAPKTGVIFVLASADSSAPYDEHLYRTTLNGAILERLSPDPGIHRIILSPSAKYYIDAHSTRTKPRAWDVASTDRRTRFRVSTADVSALAELHYAPPESLTVLAADGVTPLHGVLYKPRDFDPRKRYPVIDYIYAGPFLAVVPWGFVGNPMSREASGMAQMGFIVVLLDARGTPGRSKAFQDVNYGRVGQTEIPDHVAGMRQAAASRPYMDLERVGIFGHSWGGYFALRGVLTAPEFFKAGYAGAPGALEEEAIINEPNLGLASENPAGYAAGSNISLAGNLRGALKMMHGTSDVDASLSTTMRMAQALIRSGKHFELLIMPGEPHSPNPPADRYYRDDVNLFFARELGGPR
jgi:dipeptidyl aminopeptidase/acylaminoacyl peptidase